MEQGQRLYMMFSRGKALRFLSHLDMMRLWERALRRARLPLRYSQGYHPHPRLSLALPLSVGMTAGAEWLEVEMRSVAALDKVDERITLQLPLGMNLHRVKEAPWKAPSLTTCLRGVEYEAQVRQPPPLEKVEQKIRRFLEAESWVVEEQRKGRRVRTVDLREIVAEVEVGPWGGGQGRLRVLLHHRSGKSARLGTIMKAFGMGPHALIHRRQLIFRETCAVVMQE